jgi:Lrp/AsnC family transcriptional regulator, leucine-responsive regulatory protein
MVEKLNEIDLKLLAELETDADRSNVELARVIGLSPAATLNRVRRLKESGLIRRVTAEVEPEKAGFPLHVFIAVTLSRHDDRTHERFETTVREMPPVIRADWISGETDALLEVVAHGVQELQRVLLLLSSRGGATRVQTLLRLQELKPRSPLPLGP